MEGGVAVALMKWDGAGASTFAVARAGLPDDDAPQDEWARAIGAAAGAPPTGVVLLADPAFEGVEALLRGLDFALPGVPVIGGMASAAGVGEGRALFSWQRGGGAGEGDEYRACTTSGAVGLVLSGDVSIQPLVARGCRPLSKRTLTVTESRRHVVASVLDEESGIEAPPLEFLKAVMLNMGEDEQGEVSRNLMVGVCKDRFRSTASLSGADFLARGVLGGNAAGALSVADHVPVGTRVRFMARDRRGAELAMAEQGRRYRVAELQALVGAGGAGGRGAALGTLMFTCCGRGTRLFGRPHADSEALRGVTGVPGVGLFCDGEIGPVAGSPALLGLTCSAGVLRAGKPAGAGAAPGLSGLQRRIQALDMKLGDEPDGRAAD